MRSLIMWLGLGSTITYIKLREKTFKRPFVGLLVFSWIFMISCSYELAAEERSSLGKPTNLLGKTVKVVSANQAASVKTPAKQPVRQAVSEILLQMAKKGSAAKQLELCSVYLASEDYRLAKKWCKRAAKKRHPARQLAQYYLGDLYLHGYGVKKNRKRALHWYKKASRPFAIKRRKLPGYPQAQFTMGWMYKQRSDEAKTLRKEEYYLKQAARWYKLAAEQGHVMALNNLGLMYVLGKGIGRDFELAHLLIERAAEAGYAPAQYNLSWLYQRMGGSTSARKAAYNWLARVRLNSQSTYSNASNANNASNGNDHGKKLLTFKEGNKRPLSLPQQRAVPNEVRYWLKTYTHSIETN